MPFINWHLSVQYRSKLEVIRHLKMRFNSLQDKPRLQTKNIKLVQRLLLPRTPAFYSKAAERLNKVSTSCFLDGSRAYMRERRSER